MVQEEMSLKDISYLELLQPLFQSTKTEYAILVDVITKNISVNYFEFRPVVQEKM